MISVEIFLQIRYELKRVQHGIETEVANHIYIKIITVKGGRQQQYYISITYIYSAC